MEVRLADIAEVDALATVWHDAWRDAHAEILPQLVQYRTRQSFRERLVAGLSNLRVVGPAGQPVGFCMIKADELDQLFVSAEARGSGVAARLLADGESRLAGRGVKTAWLACAIGNDRAARFYEKHGWRRAGNMISPLDTPDGLLRLEVWRYEKAL
jgi:ribosomal protein S18 acetylase RimI-like enzyme